MTYRLRQRLQACSDLDSVLSCVLSRSLELTGALIGNVQMMDWNSGGYLTIAAQRGFDDQFLNFFARVRAEEGSACARAVRNRRWVIVEDGLSDEEFAPCRDIALAAGFRAVQSTPLISSSGAFLGVVSTHFPARHRPLDGEMEVMKLVGELRANAIIRQRILARGPDAKEKEAEQLKRGRDAIESSYRMLRRIGENLRH